MFTRALFAVLLVCASCSSDPSDPPPPEGPEDGGGFADAAVAPDAAVLPDASVFPDAETFPDAFSNVLELEDKSAEVEFEPQNTLDVLIGDLDNDQDLDLLYLNWFWGENDDREGGLMIAENLGGRNFELSAVASSTVGETTWAGAALADLDGDGDLDLVTTRPDYFRPQVGIFKNDGAGALAIDFAAVPEITAQIHGLPYAKPVPADFDGDGDVDLLIPMYVDAANTTDVPNLLLLNDGAGNFILDDTGRLPEIVDHGNYCAAASAGDVDNDGDQDIFLGVLYLQSRLLINDGTGHFLEQSGRLPSNALQPIGAEMVDADTDGDLDIITSNRSLDGVSLGTQIYENDGTGRFTLHALPGELEHETADFAIGDLNGDGVLDYAVTNYLAPEDGNGIQILLGRGGDVFEGAASEPVVGGSRSVSFADLDGDGRLDIVISRIDEMGPNVLLFGNK